MAQPPADIGGSGRICSTGGFRCASLPGRGDRQEDDGLFANTDFSSDDVAGAQVADTSNRGYFKGAVMSFADFVVFKRSRWCKRVVWAAVVFLVYTLVGFLVLPPILKWQMLKRLPGVTKRQAAIRQVKFNPLVLSLTIRGLALTEPDGRPFASWDELYINFQASSLFRWAWTFKEIRLVRPCGEVILFNDGRLNFANMFESPPKPVPPPKPKRGGIPRVNIFGLEVTNGFVAFEDRTRHPRFRTEYRPINLDLTRFTTRPNSDVPYSFHAESDAAAWTGRGM